jgi:protein-L-isoaspartate(D-aspartate) O-methyltransferase
VYTGSIPVVASSFRHFECRAQITHISSWRMAVNFVKLVGTFQTTVHTQRQRQAMIDVKTARNNMVESQVRPNAVTDHRVIDTMRSVPREAYLPLAQRSIAYMDEDVRLETGAGPARYLIQPMVFAKLVQLADIQPTDLVLDIGCGHGYSAAVLSALADSVVALECDESFAAVAIDALTDQGVDNAAVVTGPLSAGYVEEAPYDVIFLNGAVSAVPQAMLEQLKQGGRLVAVTGEGPMGQAHLYVRHGEGFSDKRAFDAAIPALPGFAAAEPAFVF